MIFFSANHIPLFVKCAAKILKIGQRLTILWPKLDLGRVLQWAREVTQNLKIWILTELWIIFKF